MEWKFDGEGKITNIAKLNRVKSIDPGLEERVLWRRETNKNIESGESVCSRASYNYSTLVTIQCLLKVRDFVARFLRATSKMASSAGLFACGQSFWPILRRVAHVRLLGEDFLSRIESFERQTPSSSNPRPRDLDYLITPLHPRLVLLKLHNNSIISKSRRTMKNWRTFSGKITLFFSCGYSFL